MHGRHVLQQGRSPPLSAKKNKVRRRSFRINLLANPELRSYGHKMYRDAGNCIFSLRGVRQAADISFHNRICAIRRKKWTII
jgi:hypothetical protein